MFYYVYVLISKKDGSTYVGYTNNINRRIKEHNNGFVPSTKNKKPFELIYFEGHKNNKMALNREMYLKTGWGRNYIKKIINR